MKMQQKILALVGTAFLVGSCSNSKFSADVPAKISTEKKLKRPASDSTPASDSDSTPASDMIIVNGGGTASSCDPNVNFIDFEALPGTGLAPTNNLNISDQFQKKFGVTFALANGRLPSIAKVDAGADSAYRCNAKDCSSDYNGLRPGQPSVGRWLLKGANGATYAQNPSPLIITYDSPTASASGNILDIDGAESWTIEALDASDAVTDTVLLRGARAQGDGIQTPFAFSHKTADIKKIRITGHSGAAFGLGFDNFATRGVCPDDQLRVPVAH